jgi:hypothetical protein
MRILYNKHDKKMASGWDLFIQNELELIHITGHQMHARLGHIKKYNVWPNEQWFQSRLVSAIEVDTIPKDCLFSLMVRDIVIDKEIQNNYRKEYFEQFSS